MLRQADSHLPDSYEELVEGHGGVHSHLPGDQVLHHHLYRRHKLPPEIVLNLVFLNRRRRLVCDQL